MRPGLVELSLALVSIFSLPLTANGQERFPFLKPLTFRVMVSEMCVWLGHKTLVYWRYLIFIYLSSRHTESSALATIPIFLTPRGLLLKSPLSFGGQDSKGWEWP